MTKIAVLQMAAQDQRELPEAMAAVDQAVERVGLADLYILPEIWTPGYFDFDRYEQSASEFEGVADFLSSLAKRTGALVHGGSIIEKRNGALHNTSLLFDGSGSLLGYYDKVHLFGYGSREQDLLTPGDKPVVVDTELGRIGLAVCYDLRFPEHFRTLTDLGAEIFLVASAWPHPRVEAWSTLLKARATENQCFLIAANGVGSATGGASLCGNSAVIDPWGVAVAAAGNDQTELTAEVDLGQVRQARGRFPALADRRLLDDGGAMLFRREGEPPLRFVPNRVVLGGYTARDEESVRTYIAKLETEGIAPPPEVPMFFPVGQNLLTKATHIDVVGSETCGEVEYVLLVADDGEIYVGVASDHTDRAMEKTSILASKQACPKPVSSNVWRLSSVRDHWDDLILRSFSPAGSDQPYQEAPASALLHPDDLLARVRARLGSDLVGTAIFGGSFSGLTGSFSFDSDFKVEIEDPVNKATLTHTYQIRDLTEED